MQVDVGWNMVVSSNEYIRKKIVQQYTTVVKWGHAHISIVSATSTTPDPRAMRETIKLCDHQSNTERVQN